MMLRDERWANVWAYSGPPDEWELTLAAEEFPELDWSKWQRVRIEVEYNGRHYWSHQSIHQDSADLARFDIFGFLLNEMVDMVDQYISEHEG